MRRSSVAAATAALLIAGSLPVFAQVDESANPLEILLDVFENPDGQEFVLQVGDTSTDAISDPRGDFEHSTGKDSGYKGQ
jgi:hypothetical protein